MSEYGTEMSSFPTEREFVKHVGLAPLLFSIAKRSRAEAGAQGTNAITDRSRGVCSSFKLTQEPPRRRVSWLFNLPLAEAPAKACPTHAATSSRRRPAPGSGLSGAPPFAIHGSSSRTRESHGDGAN